MYYRLLQKLNVNDFFHFFHHYTFWASSLIEKIYMLFYFRPMWIDTVCLPTLEFTPRDGLKMAHIFHHKLSRRREGYEGKGGKKEEEEKKKLENQSSRGSCKMDVGGHNFAPKISSNWLKELSLLTESGLIKQWRNSLSGYIGWHKPYHFLLLR